MGNINSLCFYICSFIIIIFLCALFDSSYDKNKIISKFILIIIFIILTFISGYRYNVGSDYKEYINMYNSYYTYLDFGSRTLFRIANAISKKPQTIIIIFSMLTNIFLLMTMYKLRKTNRISLIMATYLFVFFPISLNTIRQFLSMVIILYSLANSQENKKTESIILLLIAVAFHNSAVIFIPYMIMMWHNKKINAKDIVKITLTISLFLLLFTNILNNISVIRKYTSYLGKFSLNNTNYGLILSYIPFILIILSSKNKNSVDNKTNELTGITISGILLEIILSSTEGSRIGLYLSIFIIILIPRLLNFIKDELTRKTIKFTYLIFLIVYFIFVYYIVGRSKIFPYNNIYFNL